jgi:hypothetical protein
MSPPPAPFASPWHAGHVQASSWEHAEVLGHADAIGCILQFVSAAQSRHAQLSAKASHEPSWLQPQSGESRHSLHVHRSASVHTLSGLHGLAAQSAVSAQSAHSHAFAWISAGSQNPSGLPPEQGEEPPAALELLEVLVAVLLELAGALSPAREHAWAANRTATIA